MTILSSLSTDELVAHITHEGEFLRSPVIVELLRRLETPSTQIMDDYEANKACPVCQAELQVTCNLFEEWIRLR